MDSLGKEVTFLNTKDATSDSSSLTNLDIDSTEGNADAKNKDYDEKLFGTIDGDDVPMYPLLKPLMNTDYRRSWGDDDQQSFYCHLCPQTKYFTSRQTCKKHIQYCHREKPRCPYCSAKIRADNMSRHIKKYCPFRTRRDLKAAKIPNEYLKTNDELKGVLGLDLLLGLSFNSNNYNVSLFDILTSIATMSDVGSFIKDCDLANYYEKNYNIRENHGRERFGSLSIGKNIFSQP